MNHPKCVIYLKEDNISGLTLYYELLNREFNLLDVQKSTGNRTEVSYSFSCVAHLQRKKNPWYLDILGKRKISKLRIIKVKFKLKKTSWIRTCAICNNKGHKKLNCTRTEWKNHHCSAGHPSFWRNFQMVKFETENIKTQIVERMLVIFSKAIRYLFTSNEVWR